MPNIIVKNGYIKSSQHMINYMTYAGEKFEAQTLVFEDGHKMEIGADEIIDFSQYDDVKYVQVEFKDGNIRKFKPSTYESKTDEESDLVTKNTLRRENGEEIELPPDSYLEYMSQRPSVEYNPNCSHGLFDINGAVDMEEAKRLVLENEKSIKWTPIISLRREDAERVGFDNRKAWEALLKAKAYDVAKLYNISPENMVINAAFHKKDDHPHLHLFIFSKDSREGFIKDGTDGMKSRTEKLKSLFNNTIFKDDVAYLTQEKNQYRQEFKEEMKKVLQEMGKKEYRIDPEVLQGFSELSDSLLDYQGKPNYEFLPPDVKKEVNTLLKKTIELDPNLKALYQSTMQNQRAFISMYADSEEKIEARLADFEERFFQPKKKDQKTLHNIIVKNALLLNQQGTDVVRKEKTTKKPLTAKESFALGELYLKGGFLDKDIEKSLLHFNEALENEYMQYSVGKLFINEKELDSLESGIEVLKNASYDRIVNNNHEPGNQFAQYALGKLFLSNEDVQDVDQGISYLTASADQGNQFAQYTLGKLYLSGEDVPKDVGKAIEYLTASATERVVDGEVQPGNQHAQYTLGKLYLSGEDVPKDVEKALYYLKASATERVVDGETEPGNQYAQYTLGKLYLSNEDVQDVDQGISYLTASADQGNQFAQYTLGKLYLSGEDVPKDVEKALYYLKASATERVVDGETEPGNQYAQYTLGKLYLSGEDVPKDVDKGISYLTASADQDNQFAQYTLGKLYLSGEDVPKDVEKALYYLKASATERVVDGEVQPGNQYAQYTLGKLYLSGEDVPKDVDKAMNYLLASAEQGNSFAQYKIGMVYYKGVDVIRDKNKAKQYFQASAKNGNTYASEMLRRMKAQNMKQILYMSQRVLSSIAFSMSMNAMNNSHTRGELNTSNGLKKQSRIKSPPKKRKKFHKRKFNDTISY